MADDTVDPGNELSAQFILARRLNLLLDVVVAERGTPMTFLELQQKLADRGVALSRDGGSI
ncbi:hypothetical protein NHF46_00730 [Arthrobacter alpinus]|nr:hypothetical protein [Arthrobacter alpinus]